MIHDLLKGFTSVYRITNEDVQDGILRGRRDLINLKHLTTNLIAAEKCTVPVSNPVPTDRQQVNADR